MWIDPTQTTIFPHFNYLLEENSNNNHILVFFIIALLHNNSHTNIYIHILLFFPHLSVLICFLFFIPEYNNKKSLHFCFYCTNCIKCNSSKHIINDSNKIFKDSYYPPQLSHLLTQISGNNLIYRKFYSTLVHNTPRMNIYLYIPSIFSLLAILIFPFLCSSIAQSYYACL